MPRHAQALLLGPVPRLQKAHPAALLLRRPRPPAVPEGPRHTAVLPCRHSGRLPPLSRQARLPRLLRPRRHRLLSGRRRLGCEVRGGRVLWGRRRNAPSGQGPEPRHRGVRAARPRARPGGAPAALPNSGRPGHEARSGRRRCGGGRGVHPARGGRWIRVLAVHEGVVGGGAGGHACGTPAAGVRPLWRSSSQGRRNGSHGPALVRSIDANYKGEVIFFGCDHAAVPKDLRAPRQRNPVSEAAHSSRTKKSRRRAVQAAEHQHSHLFPGVDVPGALQAQAHTARRRRLLLLHGQRRLPPPLAGPARRRLLRQLHQAVLRAGARRRPVRRGRPRARRVGPPRHHPRVH